MIRLHKQQPQYDYDTLISQLVSLGYHRVDMVFEAGDIAVRGSIIDVFGYTHSHPTRIDYFGETIDRLNAFDVQSQQSLTTLETIEFHKKPHDINPQFKTMGQGEYDHTRMSQFQMDDYIVHEQFGIGYFKGLVRLKRGDYEGEFVQINYKQNDRVYVPLDQLQLIHAYSGPSTPKVTRLHDASWKQTKTKAEKSTKNIAESLYVLYQMRQTQPGFAFREDTEDQLNFESEFEHRLTEDQIMAIQTIKAQMEAPHPMDILICGDVGFGKTEVLLRAAFKALENMKQVAIIVPTTILCAQHVHVLTKRLENFGYIVGELSRFKSANEQRLVIQKLKTQQIDIVVGTHRVLSTDVQFKDLGLLIVDEEQRFGVSHKEIIKTNYAMIDVITASATPIPRTLYMSLTGTKACVQINTPPLNRKPINTHVGPYDDAVVRYAVTTEIKRGGQVYYLYNCVKTISIKLQQLQRLFPHYRIQIAHGQLSETCLQQRVTQFYSQEIDVLLCSTIIENGVDIPSVNTIIIDGAQRLGVSQIHQLRGRVGRSHRQGYAYLLYDHTAPLSEISQKRLQKIKEYTALGSGYQLAKSDLAIRGAGQLFGKEQSGHIEAVGFTLYCQLLEKATLQLQGKANIKSSIPINPQYVMIDSDYIQNPRERLALYMRFLEIRSDDQLMALVTELGDRYGTLSDHMQGVIKYLKKQLNYIDS